MALTGVWMNELNSVMVLNEHTDKGLTGKYRSMVGRDPNVRDLSGRTSALDGEKQMVAFAVCFEIAEPGRGEGHSSVWLGRAGPKKIVLANTLWRRIGSYQAVCWTSKLNGVQPKSGKASFRRSWRPQTRRY